MKKTFLKAMALTAAITIGSANIGFAAGGSIGHGNLSVYKNGQLVSKFTGQNPIEDGSLLVCDGKCMIKSEGISLVAGDKAKVAVTNEENTFKLYVKEGKVDYIINSNVRTISFYTPQGTYTVAEVIFNAGSQSAVKGTVEVDNKGKTEITVTEGRMVFATADGMKTVDANNKIVLAVAPETGTAGAAGGLFGLGTGGTIAAGALVVGAGVGTAVVIDNNNDDDDTPASPNN
ncbi:MAG: hypothetical protein HGA69_00565 [Desulfobulbaceae bacterium]|nr:hypothetical protein [Desulfobulbaceae bacterium]